MKTEIIKISFASNDCVPEASELEALNRAAETIRNGGLVVFPTETVYGLGGDATNPSAAEKIYEAKGRPSDNPLIIHIASSVDAEKYAYTNDLYYKLSERFMPGPLTVVLKSKPTVPEKTRGGLDTVAVRCPVNPIARRLISLSGVAIAAPSANLSGSPSPTKASHVIDDMFGRVDYIIDGGECDFGLESTIVKINDDNTLCLLRPGKITVDELAEIAPISVASAVVDKLGKDEIALSPGMKYRHYAPSAPLVLLDGEVKECIDYILSEDLPDIAVLCYDEYADLVRRAVPEATVYALGEQEDEEAHAHKLFDILRDADKHSFEMIYAPLPRKEGIGLALYNRMIRAAAHTIINLRR